MVTHDGRYESLKYAEDVQCCSAAKAQVVAECETGLSGEPGAASYRSICGVIVGRKSYRYPCDSTELEGADDAVARTALRFPDSEI